MINTLRCRVTRSGSAVPSWRWIQRLVTQLLVFVRGFGWFDDGREISEKCKYNAHEHEGHSDEPRGVKDRECSTCSSECDSRTADCGPDPSDSRFTERGQEDTKSANRKESAKNGVCKVDNFTPRGDPRVLPAVWNKNQSSNSNHKFDTACAQQKNPH